MLKISPKVTVHRQLLVGMDPPHHTRYRLRVNRAFTPRAIREMHALITQLAADIVAAAAETGIAIL
jgi:cytochrome P450